MQELNALGYAYCGPFNKFPNGMPVNEQDLACYYHDKVYAENDSWRNYPPLSKPEIIVDSDVKLNEDNSYLNSIGKGDIVMGDLIHYGFKNKKKRKAPNQGWMTKGRRLNSDLPANSDMYLEFKEPSGPYPVDFEYMMDTDVPVVIGVPTVYKNPNDYGRNYSFGGRRSSFRKMRYRRRRTFRRFRRYKKRRYGAKRRRINKRSFKYSKRKRLFKYRGRTKGSKLSKKLYNMMKIAQIHQEPRKWRFQYGTQFDLKDAANLMITATFLNNSVIAYSGGTANKGNIQPVFWWCPGWSGGVATSTVSYAQSPIIGNFCGGLFDQMISDVGLTAASAVNRTFIYNTNIVHEIMNTSNYPVQYTVYRCTAKDDTNVAFTGSNDHLTANATTYSHPFHLMQQYAGNTTLFPNAATVKHFGTFATNATNDSSIYVSDKHFDPIKQASVDMKHSWTVKKVGNVTLKSMRKLILREKHRCTEYNTRTFKFPVKRYVTWCYIVRVASDTYKTSDAHPGYAHTFPSFSVVTDMSASLMQSDARDYVAKYLKINNTGMAVFGNAEVMQEGQADVGVDA